MQPGRGQPGGRHFLQTSSLAHAAACRALGTMDSRAVLKQVTAPTMVVTGEEDYATPPAMGQAIADGVPAGQARVLPALRHMSLVEDPALVRQRQAELSPELAAGAPLLTEALTQVAHPQIRNRGTICGSLAHADASAEMPAVMLALNARMTIASVSGTRAVNADDFFLFHMTTAIEPNELLLSVEFDEDGPGTYTAFREFAPRKGDFCLAGAAVTVTFGAAGMVERCRVVAAGVVATPLRLAAVEELITGSSLDAADLAAAQQAAWHEVDPAGDVHASAAFTAVLVRRALAAVKTKKENDGD
jgi:aerobic carbon-monoxide dehydrogenase medium subunit